MSDCHEPTPPAASLVSSLDAPLTGNVGCCGQHGDQTDDPQLGTDFRLMAPDARKRLFGSIADRMARAPQETRLRVICRLFRADPNYGIGVAQALGIALRSATGFGAGLPEPVKA